MPICPSVCRYRVAFSNGEVLFPKLPGSADVFRVASQYAKEKGTSVVSIERMF